MRELSQAVFELTSKYNVRSVPTTILVNEEQELTRFVGAKTEEQIKSIYGN